ncbi:MAG: protein kinase [Polyangiaceae bacterium]
MPAFTPGPGNVVEDRYELTRVIGRGGMGEIWEAHDRQLEGPCAIKFILQHLMNDKEVRSRFGREAKAVARLRTPHAVHIYSVGEENQTPYLAMELLQGETLYAVLDRTTKLGYAITLSIVEQIAEALTAAHEAGIVHRDLKPDNVWLCAGNRVFVKVLDFGVAKVALGSATLRTATGSLVGTPNYMSPEQARGNRNVDHRSDLWSLAVITLECLTGKRPFESAGLGDLLIQIVSSPVPRLTEFAPDLPKGLQHWLDKALERDPNERFQTASAMVDALRPYLAEGGLHKSDDTFRPVQSSTEIGPMLRKMRRKPQNQMLRKGLWVAGAASVAVGMAAVAFLTDADHGAPAVLAQPPVAQPPSVTSEALQPAQSAAAKPGVTPAPAASVHDPRAPAAAGAAEPQDPPVVRSSPEREASAGVRVASSKAAEQRPARPKSEPAGKKSASRASAAAPAEAAEPAKPKRSKSGVPVQLLDDAPASNKNDKRLGL